MRRSAAGVLLLAPLLAGIAAAQGGGAVDPGLVASWTFDEPSGKTAKDSSGHGFDATLGESVTMQPGKIGNALTNTGASSGSTVTYAAGSALDFNASSRITLLFWLKVASLPANVRLIGAVDTGGLIVEINSTNGRIDLGTFSGSPNTGWANMVSADNAWHHYAITVDGMRASLYKDGALAGQEDFIPNWVPTGGRIFRIGGDGAYNLFGALDELRIYNRALNAQGIAAIYNAPR